MDGCEEVSGTAAAQDFSAASSRWEAAVTEDVNVYVNGSLFNPV